MFSAGLFNDLVYIAMEKLGKSLEDLFYQKEMEISKTAFTRQFTFAIVYAWVKLREQVWDLMPLYTN